MSQFFFISGMHLPRGGVLNRTHDRNTSSAWIKNHYTHLPNWSLQAFSQVYNLASYTIHLLNLQSEGQIFETLFKAILFHFQSFCQKTAEIKINDFNRSCRDEEQKDIVLHLLFFTILSLSLQCCYREIYIGYLFNRFSNPVALTNFSILLVVHKDYNLPSTYVFFYELIYALQIPSIIIILNKNSMCQQYIVKNPVTNLSNFWMSCYLPCC